MFLLFLVVRKVLEKEVSYKSILIVVGVIIALIAIYLILFNSSDYSKSGDGVNVSDVLDSGDGSGSGDAGGGDSTSSSVYGGSSGGSSGSDGGSSGGSGGVDSESNSDILLDDDNSMQNGDQSTGYQDGNESLSGGGNSSTGSGSVSSNSSSGTVSSKSAGTTNKSLSSIYYITVSKSTSGGSGTVTSSPSGINCGTACKASFNSGSSATLTASPGIGSSFNGWTGDCAFAAKAITCTLNMNSNKSVSALFTSSSGYSSGSSSPLSYNITITKTGYDGGTVTSSPAGISCRSGCSSATASFPAGSSVTFTANPGSTAVRFNGWGGVLSVCGTSQTCTLGTVNSNRNIPVNFSIVRQLTVIKNGQGFIESSPDGIACGADCSEFYSHGTHVTLTLTPDRSHIVSWLSGCTSSGRNSCYVDMSAFHTVRVNFSASY